MRATSRKVRGALQLLNGGKADGKKHTLMCPNIRFALMDAEITDLTSSGAAEMVVGPVVFENFVLDRQHKTTRG